MTVRELEQGCAVLGANVVQPPPASTPRDWEYMMWSGGVVLLGPGTRPAQPTPGE